MKKPTLKKRSKGHISMMAPPESPLNNSKLSDSPRCSTRLENSETCSTKFRKWERRRFFMAVLKILSVVVVALVTKRMVLSVIMSAFSLFFLEYVVKYVYGLFINIFVSRTMKRTASIGSIEGDTSEGDGIISDCSSLNACSEETQDTQTESDFDGRVSQDNNKILGFEDIGLGERNFENDQNYEGSGSKHRGSRRAKVKSKMKKLVPKKIRKSIKKRTGSKREELNLMEEDNYEVKEYDTEVDDDKEDIGVSASDSCEHDSDDSVVETKPQQPILGRRISILSYGFLFFVVLVGLVAGRSLAVVLTVAWCLVMKLVDCIRKRRKLP